jgi:hypothetical protein
VNVHGYVLISRRRMTPQLGRLSYVMLVTPGSMEGKFDPTIVTFANRLYLCGLAAASFDYGIPLWLQKYLR